MKKILNIAVCALLAGTMSVNTFGFAMGTYMKGSQGKEVKEIQEMLISIGYLKEGEADGIFGSKTVDAVKKFQKENKLDEDGMVGEETYKLLKEAEEKTVVATVADVPPAATEEKAEEEEQEEVATVADVPPAATEEKAKEEEQEEVATTADVPPAATEEKADEEETEADAAKEESTEPDAAETDTPEEEQKNASEADEAVDYELTFPSWNPDSETLDELVDFVIACTDESSPEYLEPEDRIATFDMDGTILCEKAPVYFDYCLTMYRVLDDLTFEATEEEIDAMQQIRDHAYSEGATFKPESVTKDDLVASAFAGMTPEEFREYVVEFADNTEAVGFEGMTYGESFYQPMIEVIDFLRGHDFDVWIVSACEREVVRALVERFDIPYDHCIATDVPYVASNLGEEAADEYNMGQDETILLGAPLDEVECGKSGKPAAIAREIGKRPVLAFGNSSGDYSMLNYAEGNPYHTGMGFFVVCDDTVREYGSDEKAAEYYEVVEKENWTGISMANDWINIYGEGVKKTELPGTETDLLGAVVDEAAEAVEENIEEAEAVPNELIEETETAADELIVEAEEASDEELSDAA